MAYNRIEIDSGQVDTWTGAPIYSYQFEDDKTGDLYEAAPYQDTDHFGASYTDYKPGNLIATGAALNNPDIQNLRNQYNLRGSDNPGAKYLDPVFAQQFYDLKQSDPTAYYNQLSTDIGGQIAENTAWNKGEHNVGFTNQLNQIKEIDPAAYYKAQLGILGDSIGWQIGQNRSDRNAPTLAKIQELAPEAMKAGLSAEQINSLVGNSVNAANYQNQNRIANEAASGGSGFNLGELVRGVAPIAAFAIGAPLMAGAFGAGAAGAGALETAGAAGLTGGGAFVPAAGSGASFVLPGAAAAAPLTTSQILSSTGFTPTAGNSFSIIPGAAYTTAGSYVTPELMGPTYQELGVTGLEAGQMGPTYGELGYTGLNQGQAIAAADAAAKAAAGSSLLSNAGDLLKGAQLAKGLLGAGQNPLQAQAMGVQQPQQMQQRQYAGVDYSPILNLLAVKSPTRSTYSLLG